MKCALVHIPHISIYTVLVGMMQTLFKKKGGGGGLLMESAREDNIHLPRLRG